MHSTCHVARKKFSLRNYFKDEIHLVYGQAMDSAVHMISVILYFRVGLKAAETYVQAQIAVAMETN